MFTKADTYVRFYVIFFGSFWLVSNYIPHPLLTFLGKYTNHIHRTVPNIKTTQLSLRKDFCGYWNNSDIFDCYHRI